MEQLPAGLDVQLPVLLWGSRTESTGVEHVCADSSVETPRHSGDFSRFSLSLTPQSMAKKFGTIRLLAMEVSRRRCESSEILLAPFGVSARPTSS